jgi:hypothetical protein
MKELKKFILEEDENKFIINLWPQQKKNYIKRLLTCKILSKELKENFWNLKSC